MFLRGFVNERGQRFTFVIDEGGNFRVIIRQPLRRVGENAATNSKT